MFNNLQISFISTLTTDGGLKSLTLQGDWIINTIRVKTSLIYDHITQQVLLKAFPESHLSISQVIDGFLKTNIKVPSFLNAVKFTSIIGQTTTGSISIISSGRIGTKFNIYIVYQNMMGTIPSVALAASINSLRFADIIKEVINIDIGGVPFFWLSTSFKYWLFYLKRKYDYEIT